MFLGCGETCPSGPGLCLGSGDLGFRKQIQLLACSGGFCAQPPLCFCRALEGSQHPNPTWVLIRVNGASQTKPSSAGRDVEQVWGSEWPPVGPTPWLQWPDPLWAMVSPKPSCPIAFSSPADGTVGPARVVGRVTFPSVALLEIGHNSCLLSFFPPSAIGVSSPGPGAPVLCPCCDLPYPTQMVKGFFLARPTLIRRTRNSFDLSTANLPARSRKLFHI